MKKLISLLIFAPTIAIAALLVGSASVTVGSVPQIIDVSNRKFPITVSLIPQAGTTGTIEFSNSI
ncbi:MAG TPA: hypothetical protein VFM18_20785, partial [Methanosarcina sp.]|nr:hypothetical protein [Methanosarcina sp.]